ncbi:MAG: adenylate cyclase [halophilic archaeon J07HX64]|jgi:adenylate cyclase|nr:MAG: adenylate cyclase [halophilic archaeon J07HX64]
MYEVEMKLRADHDPLRQRLTAMDADHIGGVTQTDTYYDAPDRDFAETDEAFRVRRETDHPKDGRDLDHTDATAGDKRVLLTYKGPLVDDTSKTREEAETRVAEEAELEAILAGLGYEPAATVHKNRDRYEVGGCRVTLDRVDEVGEFVEVEHHDPVAETEIEGAREAVTDLLVELDLNPGESIQTSYLGLVLAGR